uniref:NADH dehydrogenase subunit 3 n=2 Tax=Panagrolaimus sp. JU765 TaxID=591449 RepID=A0AC34R027_9BILA
MAVIDPTLSSESPFKTQAPWLSEAVFQTEFIAFVALLIILATVLVVYSVSYGLKLKNTGKRKIPSNYTIGTDF